MRNNSFKFISHDVNLTYGRTYERLELLETFKILILVILVTLTAYEINAAVSQDILMLMGSIKLHLPY